MSDINVESTSEIGPPAGSWRIAPGHALTLRSGHGGRLRIARGGLWATFDGPHAGPANDRGDHLLHAGSVIALRPGERLVMEPVGRTTSAFVEWEPAAAATPVPAGVRLLRGSAPADVLGARVPGAAVRVLLALAAVGLTAGLWLGAAAESGRHRDDSRVLAGQATRAPAVAAKRVTAPATARAGVARVGPPA